MVTLDFDKLQHADVLRLSSGTLLNVRFVEPRDAERLQNYFRSFTTRSRYNRFLGAVSELSAIELEHFVHPGEDDGFSVIATVVVDGFETIVGEARCAINASTATAEFALSIEDRWQGHGVGSALLRNLERAIRDPRTRQITNTLAQHQASIVMNAGLDKVVVKLVGHA